jgi:hypothetical protein
MYKVLFPNHKWKRVTHPMVSMVQAFKEAGVPYYHVNGNTYEFLEWALDAFDMWQYDDDMLAGFNVVDFITKMKPQYQVE